MAERSESDISRILVALDPCRQNRATLEQALALAERMRAELIALFVEDENLLRLAGLPFAREVHRTSAAERKLDAGQMVRTLQRQIETLRQQITRSAEQRHIRASVRVVRGQFIHVALTAAGETDVAFLNIVDRSASLTVTGKPSSAATARPKPVWAVFDGSPESVRALDLACELGASAAIDLLLAVPAPNPGQARELKQKAAQRITELRATAKVGYTTLPPTDCSALLRAIRRQGCSLLVLHRDSPLLLGDSLRQLIDTIDCPVVLVR